MSIKNDRWDTPITVISFLALSGGFSFLLVGTIVGSQFGWHSIAIGLITSGGASCALSIIGGTLLLRKEYWREKQVEKLEEGLKKIRTAYNDLNL